MKVVFCYFDLLYEVAQFSQTSDVIIADFLGQLASLFSKSVAIIAGRPKRDFSFFLASLYAISGLALTVYCSCSTTFFAFPSKCWLRRYSFCWAPISVESIGASKAVSHVKNLVSDSLPVKTSGLACGSLCSWVTLAKASEIWTTLSELGGAWFLP